MFLTKLLNIEGIQVISQRQHEGIGIILQLEQIGKESSSAVGQKAIDYIKIIELASKIYLGERNSYF